MDIQRCICITTQKRVREERGGSLIELDWMVNSFPKEWWQVLCSLSDHCFWNGIGSKNGAEVEQFSRGGIGLADFLEGEGPGSSNRSGVVLAQTSTYLQDVTATGLITWQVIW